MQKLVYQVSEEDLSISVIIRRNWRVAQLPKSKKLGSGALSGKIFLVRIIENNKIDAYFRAG